MPEPYWLVKLFFPIDVLWQLSTVHRRLQGNEMEAGLLCSKACECVTRSGRHGRVGRALCSLPFAQALELGRSTEFGKVLNYLVKAKSWLKKSFTDFDVSVSCCAFSLLRTQHLRIAINYGAVIQFSERLTEPKVNYVHWETNTPGIFEASRWLAEVF